MASGPALYVVRVEHRVSSLQLLCQQAIASALREDKDISKLSLPPRLCSYLSTAFIPTIKVDLSGFLPPSRPTPSAKRTAEAGDMKENPRAGASSRGGEGVRPRRAPPCSSTRAPFAFSTSHPHVLGSAQA